MRIYTGRPDPREGLLKTYAAHMRQCDCLGSIGCAKRHQLVRSGIHGDGLAERAQEKGVDIALAIDFVTMAIEPEYDVGVIMSTDTDLLPALEFVRGRTEVRQTAVAAWRSQGRHRRLTLRYPSLWCYWLDRDDYDAVADLAGYAR